ncbi:hypothetical protein CPC735_037760 [Coccidioides posadasii C735 delta SOWgp]|uniref:Protein PNS1 n=1 Tax=Coccidioides posadasii (strain C735) TaxID=222929 RepID=C5P2G7_COCP7|nr:hypothetical protein CPC735_037760 [Coccidioides posadasii C735 delta SOWgp]EER29070.1 hypothetical protein CPC735_037760 [Coccidioides posadasii C735 delta SOWgp]|eukprot:XP_003071215.1 hypothetical protein CPC735_037760 [Coccidioides posadasii C735 delta SOWgp]
MFSEYASRFLAQSQSRIGFAPDSAQNTRDRQRRPNQSFSRFPASRSYLNRGLGNPYNQAGSSHLQLPFGRGSTQAPLFYSTTDQFREEDDEQEHEREIADYFALQRSRRNFGAIQMEESSELEGGEEGNDSTEHADGFGQGRGIRSSWRGGNASGEPSRRTGVETLHEQKEEDDDARSASSKGKGKMVDVRLEDSVPNDMVNLDNGLHSEFHDDNPPAVQQFRRSPFANDSFQASSSFIPRETDKQTLLDHPQPPSPGQSEAPRSVAYDAEPPMHDAFWGHLFLLSLAGLFASSLMVYLHTSEPSGKPGLGDTIYSTLHASFYLLGTYTLVSIFVSLLWLALLKSYVRPLVYAMLIAVPVILYSFALYSFVSSFKGSWHGASVQDKVMRWGSLVPAIMATAWVYSAVKGRHSTGKAISILEFSCRILSANSPLLIVGLATLALIAAWTWAWILMFTRVFLGGHLSKTKSIFIINPESWWLGAYFILIYLWSLGVIAGIQRSVTAATVSQWYFHRLAVPSITPRQIVPAALSFSLTTMFGTICLSTFLSLLIRLPLIILPRRLSSLLSLAAYSIIPTPIAALTNPLTLTYASIFTQPLTPSARTLSQLTFLAPSSAATTIHPRSFSSNSRHEAPTLVPYRLAKLLLHATRFIMSLALGFAGWVSSARKLQVSDGSSTVRGSLYAYVVGMLAGALGWGVLAAMEGVLACVLDAAVVCWATEVGTTRREVKYCREAGWLFGGERERHREEV